MLRLLTTIFLICAGIFLYSYFRELNPGTVTVRTSPSVQFDLSPVTLVIFSMAVGAVLVALAVGMRQTAHVIGNWRSTRLLRRKEKIDVLHREGTHAFMSKRTVEAIGLFEKALAMDPNRVDSLLWLGNIYRAESNFAEAIRLHQRANRVDDRNIEILLELAKDLEGAKRYEDALQTLHKMLKIEPDNLTALIRERDLLIRLEKWSEALEIQHRLLKANLPEPERRAEAHLLTGCTYEVGRQLLERGHPDKARRYFRGAIKKDRTFLPAYIGIGRDPHPGRQDQRRSRNSEEGLCQDPQHYHSAPPRRTLSRTGRTQRNYPCLSGSPPAGSEQPRPAVLSRQALLPTRNGRRSLRHPLDRRRDTGPIGRLPSRSWPISFFASSTWSRPSLNLRKPSISRNVWSSPMSVPSANKTRRNGPGGAAGAATGIRSSHFRGWTAVKRPVKTSGPHPVAAFPTRALLLHSKPCSFRAAWRWTAEPETTPLGSHRPPGNRLFRRWVGG